MYTEIKCCRVCGNGDLKSVLNLGHQALTGVFPRTESEMPTVGPLELVKCTGTDACGLVQLRHSYTLSEMYGANYGYRSGLNASMVAHLKQKVDRISETINLVPGDLVLDIGSNDGTTLSLYGRDDLTLVGMDPTSEKFREYYGKNVCAIADFFSASTFRTHFGNRKAKVVTSFSMFYDLEDPVAFVQEVAEILDDQGIWVLEQSYLPKMIETNSYDTVCHEHLEYYALAQIEWILTRCGLRVIEVELNDVNGGSFSLTVQKTGGELRVSDSVREMREAELALGLDRLETYAAFENHVHASQAAFKRFLEAAKVDGKSVVALGASTKGNVILQYCGVSKDLISSIGEVNADKFGSVSPGTCIPIVDEKEILATNPDYVVVLPWHFRAYFEQQDRYKNLNLVYPLPTLQIRKANS